MAQIIYGLTQDNGDGSSSIRWFKNKDDVDKVLEQEEFYANESEPAETLTFPDEKNAASAFTSSTTKL
jgi:hypothetical protein